MCGFSFIHTLIKAHTYSNLVKINDFFTVMQMNSLIFVDAESEYTEQMPQANRSSDLPHTLLHERGGFPTNLDDPSYTYDNSRDDDTYDDDVTEYDVDDVAPRAAKLKQNASHQKKPPPHDGKTKRAQNRKQEDEVRTENKFVVGGRGEEEIQVEFRSLVRHHVSAYVTWPEKIDGCGATLDSNAQEGSGVVEYVLRYTRDDNVHPKGRLSGVTSQRYAEKNLTMNVAVLENLLPNSRYRYRVKYVFLGGHESAWSQERTLDTHFPS